VLHQLQQFFIDTSGFFFFGLLLCHHSIHCSIHRGPLKSFIKLVLSNNHLDSGGLAILHLFIAPQTCSPWLALAFRFSIDSVICLFAFYTAS